MSKELNESTKNVKDTKVVNLYRFRYQNELYVLNVILKNIGRILVPYITNINYILMSFFKNNPEANISEKDIDNLKLIGASLTKILDSLNGIVLTVNRVAMQIKDDGHIRDENLNDKFSIVYEIINSLEEIAMQTNILALSKMLVATEMKDENLNLAVNELQNLAAESIRVTRYVSDLIKKDVSENEE
mgnify:CR=1 FL=1